MDRTVIGVFSSKAQAERAVSELREKGFSNQISILARGSEGAKNPVEEVSNRVTLRGDVHENPVDSAAVEDAARGPETGNNETVLDGAGWGASLGGAAGLLAGAGFLALPGFGPILAAGPISAALTGAATGGIAGGLLDYGIPDERGRRYEEEVRSGRILAIVRTDARKAEEAAQILRRNGASSVETHDAMTH